MTVHSRSGNEPISHSVVHVVAAGTEETVTDLEPLARAIDVDASHALFSPASSKHDDQAVEVSFRYAGFRVEIGATGRWRSVPNPKRRTDWIVSRLRRGRVVRRSPSSPGGPIRRGSIELERRIVLVVDVLAHSTSRDGFADQVLERSGIHRRIERALSSSLHLL